jgi:hypothetical protein
MPVTFPPAPEAVLTPRQVADWLQVSTKTLATLPIRSKKLGHRTRRYLARDVLDYLGDPSPIRRRF